MDFVTLPRWVVYCQAILLGLVATTCFIGGIFVGSFGKPDAANESRTELRVSGTIKFRANDAWHADAGAVVLILPVSPQEVARQNPSTLTPQFFEPLENPAIASVRAAGGDVVRANLEGKFELFVRAGKYELVVISNGKSDERQQQLSREQVASLSQFFLPVENLIGKRRFDWRSVSLSTTDIEVGEIKFE